MSINHTDKDLRDINKIFYENLCTLKVFNEQIGPLAEEYDKAKIQEFSKELTELVSFIKVTTDLSCDNSHDLLNEQNQQEFDLSLKKTPQTEATTSVEYIEEPFSVSFFVDSGKEESNEELSGAERNIKPEDERQLFQVVKYILSSKIYTARQSKLLRQGALISLTSYFESLISDLLQFFYLTYPAALPSDGKLLSLAELREIGSVEEAERLLISKEIDALLRDSTSEQIEYFTKRPKVDLKCLSPYVDSLLEVVQRRNLFVHNNGIVNKLYLSKLSKEYLGQNRINEGDTLEIDGEYLSKAIDTICVCGTMLIQQSWRKWDENNIEAADDVLREFSYDLLVEKRWDLVDKIATYATNLHFVSDSYFRIVIVNQAIALKEQNKIAEMESLLRKKDWSSCALKFHVALCALEEQYERMIPLLSKAIAAEEIEKENIDEWPLFRWFRETEHYQSVQCELFPQQ